MEIPTIYCQMGFLEKLISKASESLDSLLFDEDYSVDAVSACFKLLYGKSRINIDATIEALIEHPNPLVKKFIKNPTAHIIANNNIEEKLSQENFWQTTTTELFMLDKSETEAASLEADWGIMLLTIESLAKMEVFLSPSPPIPVIQSQEGFKWQLLEFARHYFHSVIIVDNYLNDNDNELRENIIPLILSLCKGKPNRRKLSIALITTSDKIHGIHSKMRKFLNQYKIEATLSVSKTQTLSNHDRHCITNRLWISSGFGFNILAYNRQNHKLQAIRDTTLFIMPRLSNRHIHNSNGSLISHRDTFFTASQAIISKLNKLMEESKVNRGTQSWHIESDFDNDQQNRFG
jgi:hypothetical protein